MQTNERAPWLARGISAVLTCAVLLGTVGTLTTDVAAARKRVSPKLVQTFGTSAPIAIPDNGATVQSTVSVSGFSTDVADVNVTLNRLTHPNPQDLDILLVGPGGQTSFLISDLGFNNAATDITLTLDDSATSQVSSINPLINGTFQPANFDNSDSFSPPGPANPPNGSELGVFNSTDPNGTWTLFLRDDSSGSSGTLAGGWTLRITSANGVPNASPDDFQAQAGKPLSEPPFGVLANDLDPDNDTLTAILAAKPKKGTLQLAPDGSFTYRPNKKAKGTDSFTYLAQDPGGLTDLETATIHIKKAKKKHRK